ncbi:MAG: flavodoxin [Bacteroides sp.]|nr:flavodoxin [Roseburia sp.]MCM1347721.1 flavodoxin [Bacteroides sp.]MCM1421649.1 flavodoxin [Bacteroides sp.]
MKKLLPIVITMLSVVGIFASTSCSNKTQNQAKESDKKMIVCYFSATGTTAAQAKRIAEITGAGTYEIVPETAYTAADLDWTDSLSRSSVEMHNKAFRPALKDSTVNLSEYDIVFIGYPNWWNTCPTIINTFVETAQLDGKTVVPFMTSGGSNITNSEKELSEAYPGINWKKGLLMNEVSDNQIKDWLEDISK